MAKKKAKVVWIWRDCSDDYCFGGFKPEWSTIWEEWSGRAIERLCDSQFERLFPFFKVPKKSFGKITNTANTLTFEVVETKK